MSINNKDWLNIALELYDKIKDLGHNQNLGKKELEMLIDLAGKFNSTGQNPLQSEKEEKTHHQAGLSDLPIEEHNTFWQEQSAPQGGMSASEAVKAGYAPPISIYETVGGINVHVILPGVASSDNLTLLLSRETLELSGIRGAGALSGGVRKRENFFRTVRLPAPVEPSEATANYRNGFLYISAPKEKHASALKIEVKFE